VSCSGIYGWACDPDNFAQAIDVHVYEGNTMIMGAAANASRVDAAAACGGYGSHGFSFALPVSLKDGKSHTLTTYAINIGQGQNVALNAATPTFTCVPASSSAAPASSSSRPSSSSLAASSSSVPAVCEGTATIGLFNPASAVFSLRNSKTAGAADTTFGYGGANWKSLMGDWNGDGIDTPGVFDPTASSFYLRNTNSSGYADITLGFGSPNKGWIPLAGDWNGDGIDTIGAYDPSGQIFYLRNSNTSGSADLMVAFTAGSFPLVGDWNGDGIDTVGAFNPTTGIFTLRNVNTSGPVETSFTWQGAGGYGYQPLVGDWNGDGIDSMGLYLNATSVFFFKNANVDGGTDSYFTFGTAGAGSTPLAGRFCVGSLPLKPACADGVDNDGDGKADYPQDPGCICLNDPNETNAPLSSSSLPLASSSARSCGVCDDGNKCNGIETCNQMTGACVAGTPVACSGLNAACYPADGNCYECSTDADCINNQANHPGETTCWKASPSWGMGVCQTSCGNGIKQGSEGCDDANVQNGDGCSASCTVELGWVCSEICPAPQAQEGLWLRLGHFVASLFGTTDTLIVQSTSCPSVCASLCGDGIKVGVEQCDDHNTTSGDGCSATCTLENGTCGNGRADAGEQCDDSNALSGDGCSSTCRFECSDTDGGNDRYSKGITRSTWTNLPRYPLTVYVQEDVCEGDTLFEYYCTKGGDYDNSITGSSGRCENGCNDGACIDPTHPVSSRSSTSSSSSRPATGCGNGTLETGERCDDGNTVGNDGCSATCQSFCSEWDGGNDPYLYSPTAGGNASGTISSEDVCLSPTQLRETYCAVSNGEYVLRETTVNCSLGCTQNGCVGVSLTSVVTDGETARFILTNRVPVLDWCPTCFCPVLFDDQGVARANGSAFCSLGENMTVSQPVCTVSGCSTVSPGMRVQLCVQHQGCTPFVTVQSGNASSASFSSFSSLSSSLSSSSSLNSSSSLSPSSSSRSSSSMSPGCGDGILQSGEQCDDSNALSGDGCSSSCFFECTDTDGGQNIYLKGTTRTTWTPSTPRYPLTVTTQEDVCDGNLLTENYCYQQQGTYYHAIVTWGQTCARGCSNGACVMGSSSSAKSSSRSSSSSGISSSAAASSSSHSSSSAAASSSSHLSSSVASSASLSSSSQASSTSGLNCDDGNICTIDASIPFLNYCIHFNFCSPSESQDGLSVSVQGVSSVAPGSSFQQSVIITNNGTTTAISLVQASLIDTTNGTPASFPSLQPTQSSGIAYLPVGTILMFYGTTENGLTLAPGQSKTIPISIEVPATAPCNSTVKYFAGLVPLSANMTPIEKSVSINIVCAATTSSVVPATTAVSSSGTNCGNTRIDSGEQCDDGNRTSGDGCSSACKFECTDSDGGNNMPYVLGTVRSTWTRTPTNPLTVYTKTDACQGDSLLEYGCSKTSPYEGAISTRMTPCSKGCANGACLP